MVLHKHRYPRTGMVAKVALFSRLLVIFLALVANALVDDYDSSFALTMQPPPRWSSETAHAPLEPGALSDAYAYHLGPGQAVDAVQPSNYPGRPTLTDDSNGLGLDVQHVLGSWLQVFVRWDAVYFVHLAEEGHYIFEQEHAFFPMLPLLIRFVASTVLHPLIALVGFRLTIILAGVLVSNASFIASAVVLYRLGVDVLLDERLAYLAALCYCFTPSNIFMSAIYTESLFALFSFICMRLVAQRHYLLTAYFISLGSLTRSNSIVYCGFFLYDLLVHPLQHHQRQRPLLAQVGAIAWAGARATVYCAIALTGFVLFQLYGYKLYCTSAQINRPWCHARIPLLYSFVQTHYWNVGFLNYYELKQIPNFLLAGPMIALSAWGIYTYARANWRRFLSAGIASHGVSHDEARSMSPARAAYTNDALIPHVYLWLVLLLYALLNIHIQVITRFFSSQPIVYWFSAYVFLQPPTPTTNPSHRAQRKPLAVSPSGKRAHPRSTPLLRTPTATAKTPHLRGPPHQLSPAAQCLLYYYSCYGFIGIVLFSNFFPPA
ncbi:ER membrane glycoprotein subunit of the GPI transamidase complex-like protein [Dimargaris verticillata]|uniref:GPI mannosyltransferase 2 n=1 Tax=Dimargaris verticillata TaxID=2761393 RepID=A0A9W8EDM5_9FUNG|nr:ER membrane glycoprotein subunit of the GPI transamidase complex-like protein [Dimargaris verticillata]